MNADLNTISPVLDFDNKKKYNANYHKENKDRILQQKANYYELNKQKKLHYCDVCEKAFGNNGELQRHFYTIKHGYTYLNSLD